LRICNARLRYELISFTVAEVKIRVVASWAFASRRAVQIGEQVISVACESFCMTERRLSVGPSGIVAALVVATAFAISLFQRVEANSNLDLLLREWIEDDLHFFPDANKLLKLAIRREAVRAHVYSEIRPLEADIRLTIGLFAQAFEVPVEFTRENANLGAAVMASISDGDRPNRIVLKGLGLPDNAIDQIARSGGWASGCGHHIFANQFGGILLGLALADKNLASNQIKDCLTDGISRAFGLRTKRTSATRARDGYVHYLLLAKALRQCDRELVLSAEDRMSITNMRRAYSGCASQFIQKAVGNP
jgi:hypothetical protein